MDHAQNLSGPAPNIWLAMFQISSKSVHFRQSYNRTREGRFLAPRVFALFASNNLEVNNNTGGLYCYKFHYLVISLLYSRFPFSLWLHCSSSTDVTGCRSGYSCGRGDSGQQSPTSAEICWMLSPPWNCPEGMGRQFRVSCFMLLIS